MFDLSASEVFFKVAEVRGSRRIVDTNYRHSLGTAGYYAPVIGDCQCHYVTAVGSVSVVCCRTTPVSAIIKVPAVINNSPVGIRTVAAIEIAVQFCAAGGKRGSRRIIDAHDRHGLSTG